MNASAVNRSNRWIPWLFVFGFAVIVAVNATLITFAASSFSGLVVEHPYRKGIAYSQTQHMLDAQKQLHWDYRVHTELRGAAEVDFVVVWQEQNGATLNGLRVTAEFSRPVENAPPVTVTLDNRGHGVYGATVDLSRDGVWDARIVAEGNGARFVAAERLIVP